MADESALLSAYCKVPCVLKDTFNTSFQIINYIRPQDSITNIVPGSYSKLKVCHR